VVGDAYLAPILNLPQVFRIFWPLLLADFVLIGSRYSGLFSAYGSSGLLGMVAILLGVGAVFACGLYRWHRYLVLEEPQSAWGLLSSGVSEWRLFVWWVGVGAMFYLFVMLSQVAVAPIAFAVLDFAGTEKVTGRFSFDQFGQIRLVGLILFIVVYGLASILFAFTCKRLVLFLPLVSVERRVQQIAARASWAGPNDRWFPIAIVLTSWPIMVAPLCALFGLRAIGVLSDPHGSPFFVGAAATMSLFTLLGHLLFVAFSVYGVLVFASLLSIYYRERVRGTLPDANMQRNGSVER
jgi:hypothetical protein